MQDAQDSRAVLKEQLKEDFAQHQVPFSRTEIENLLSSTEEDNIIKRVTTKSQVEFIVGNSDGAEGGKEIVMTIECALWLKSLNCFLLLQL